MVLQIATVCIASKTIKSSYKDHLEGANRGSEWCYSTYQFSHKLVFNVKENTALCYFPLQWSTYSFFISNVNIINKTQRDVTLVHKKYTRETLK